MVWTKSSAASHWVAGDTDPDDAASCSERYSAGRGESFRFSSASHRNRTGANAATGISESGADGRAGDY